LLVFAIAVTLASLAVHSQAQTFKVLYNFTNGDDGANPLDGFVAVSGYLYGTTSAGGSSGAGTVFKISEAGKFTPLYSFKGGTDGSSPQASLLREASGDLYGTTSSGGAYGNGTIFRVTPKGVETVLYSFKGGTTDGADPQAALVVDSAGNLYGTTFAGGTSGAGTVFELTKKGKESVLHSFGSLGTNPVAGVTFDAAGNLYGTTSTGGLDGNGTVYELAAQSAWAETTLHDFTLGTDGGVPYAGLVFDGSGNIFGATTDGGASGSDGGGTIFELTPDGTGWTFNTLYGLAGWGISGSFRNVLLDASGNIYATTHCDGAYNSGTVYKLTNSGGTWTYDELYTLTGGSDGQYSFSNLVADKKGNLYGTARQAGGDGYGVVFKVTP
jgi:uncharacterized repeat protein (TIGR03803 family)